MATCEWCFATVVDEDLHDLMCREKLRGELAAVRAELERTISERDQFNLNWMNTSAELEKEKADRALIQQNVSTHDEERVVHLTKERDELLTENERLGESLANMSDGVEMKRVVAILDETRKERDEARASVAVLVEACIEYSSGTLNEHAWAELRKNLPVAAQSLLRKIEATDALVKAATRLLRESECLCSGPDCTHTALRAALDAVEAAGEGT